MRRKAPGDAAFLISARFRSLSAGSRLLKQPSLARMVPIEGEGFVPRNFAMAPTTAQVLSTTSSYRTNSTLPFFAGGSARKLSCPISEMAAMLRITRDDIEFARYLVEKIGVAAVPASSFYRAGAPEAKKMIRFNFAKRNETIQEAGRRLLALKK